MQGSSGTGGPHNAPPEVALIVGGGPGISGACARLFAAEGMRVAIAQRRPDKPAIRQIIAHTQGAVQAYRCDVAEEQSVAALFQQVEADLGAPHVVVFNPSARVRGPVADISASGVKAALLVSTFGGFLVGQQAARRMLARGSGSILFTGASASYKGYAGSASFAMGKFGLTGLAQSMARELAPRGVHVAHFPIDGGVGTIDYSTGIRSSHWSRYREQSTSSDYKQGDGEDTGDTMLSPDAIAQAYLFVHRQPRSAWTFEMQLRPWVESW
jgi:NAD(P)-dependent dehydrogenase (short-subunit alcohol dehydrogenase family)